MDMLLRLHLAALALGLALVAPAVQASFLHRIIDVNDDPIGTLEFTTPSGNVSPGVFGDPSTVLQASITLAGVQFTLADLKSASWSTGFGGQLNVAFFSWRSPNFGGADSSGTTVGYNITVSLPPGTGGIQESAQTVTACLTNPTCKAELDAVRAAAQTTVQGFTAVTDVPEPPAALLLVLGLVAGTAFRWRASRR